MAFTIESLWNAGGTFLLLFGELFLLFIGISFLVAMLQIYISKEKIQRVLTTPRKSLNSILGAMLGAVTPFCSCSTVPICLLYTSQSVIRVTIITIIASLLGVRFACGPGGFLLIVAIIFLFSFGVSGISISLGAVIHSHETLMAIVNFLTMPLMFTSNAMFPVEAMPAWLQSIARWNPLSYAVDVYKRQLNNIRIWR